MLSAESRDEVKARACLRCGKVFMTDRWHRICHRCHKHINREGVGRLVQSCKVSTSNSHGS